MLAEQVRQIIGRIFRVVGSRPFSFQWDRSGGAEFDLVAGDASQWSTANLFGQYGRIKVACHGLPIVNPELRYEVTGNEGEDLKLVGEAEFPGLAGRLSPVATQGVGSDLSGPVGFSPLTAISLLSMIWSILYPRVTLKLPPSVVLSAVLGGDGKQLEVTFSRPPTVAVNVIGLSLVCCPNRFLLQERWARVEYRFGFFSRHREWSW